MSLWSKLTGELIDVIEWTDDSRDTMIWRFERHGNEIKMGARLTVRESQMAVFVNEGRIADVYQPGLYTLETQNMPVLTTLMGWKYGFQSPFKAEVYFVNTRRFTNLKWGTKNPIPLRDPEFGPIRLRGFGTYALRVSDPVQLVREIAGTDAHFTTDEVTDQIRNIIVSRITDILGESKIPVLDLAANYDELSRFLTDRTEEILKTYGLELVDFAVENISLPPAVEEALDKRASMGVLGNLAAYTQYQTAEAIGKAAGQPGAGGAAEGMGLGMGMAMASQMAQTLNQNQSAGQGAQAAPRTAGPPPLPGQTQYYIAVDGEQQGPFPMDQLSAHVGSGALTRDTLVWTEGMPGWTKAGEVSELSSLFAGPPPLPTA